MKKKNPQDVTLRNINALKKRVKKLEDNMLGLIACYKAQSESLHNLRKYVKRCPK